MKLLKKLTVATLALIPALYATAQNRSAYFVDNYTYGFMLNPAFANEKGFVSFPALGTFNMGTRGNVGLDNFFFVENGKTTTFMNPAISESKFLGKLANRNRLGLNVQEGIMAVGFNAFGGYNTISLSASAEVEFSMPKSIFALYKQGLSNRTYDISNFDAHADGYVAFALNHSRQITPDLRVGAAVKFLVGGANIDVDMQKAHLALGEDNWQVLTNASVRSNMVGLRYETKYSKETGRNYVSGVKIDDPNVGGYGVAFDFGGTYNFMNMLKFSLAFNDVGFITWKNDVVATTNGDRTFNLNDYEFDPDNMDGSFDQIKDRLFTLYQLDNMGDMGKRTRALAATMNAGVEYTLPYYKNLSFGLLNTTRMAKSWAWTEFRLSAQIRPVKPISIAANYGVGTFGSSFGWMFNLFTPGFNLYVGMDHTLGKLSKQFVPINPNAQVSLGINFPFGR